MRLKKLWLTILLICCSLLVLAGCKANRVVESISLKGYSAEYPLNFGIGKFSYSEKFLLIKYDNGEIEEIPLTEDMIPETDKLKFYQDGENEIAIMYQSLTTTIKINVFRNQFSDNVQLKDFTATYTGKTFTVEVEGDIPGNAKILYPQGNTFKNAGLYDMTAILQCDGYESKVLSARIIIEKATYDVTNAQLYNETVDYDKDSHGLALKGKELSSNGTTIHSPANLPQGVSVNYTITKVKDGKGNDIDTNKQQLVSGNKAIDAGVYKVCAHFKGDASNYNAIPDSVAYLTINRALYDLSKIEFWDFTATYSGEVHTLEIEANNKLPLDVAVSYQIKKLKNGAGEEISDAYTDGNTAIDTGEYLVRANFSVNGKNAENYITAPLYKEARLTILRASYDEQMKDVDLDTQWFAFKENKTYEIFFDYALPQGVSPIFVLTDENGEMIQGEMEEIKNDVGNDETAVKTTYKYSFKVEEAGEYTCVVTFIHENEHYKEIDLRITAWIIISNEV